MARSENSGKKNADFLEGIQTFSQDSAGSITIFVLFIFACMFMVAGLAVDLMRYETTRIEVQNTLDRGILAAADLENDLTPEEVMDGYFNAADLGHLIVDTYVDTSGGGKTVAARTTAQVPSLFIQSLGIDFLNAPASGAAEESKVNVEIALALDHSGSMFGSKHATLQAATETFINLVMDSDNESAPEKEMTMISMIPYNSIVEVPESMSKHLNWRAEHDGDHICAHWRTDDFSSSYLSGTTEILMASNFDRSGSSSSRSHTSECKPWFMGTIRPFYSNAQDLIDEIYGVKYALGLTSISTGAKWGISMLSPGMQDVVSGMVADGTVHSKLDGRPYDFDDGSLKVLVLMSDGENTYNYEIWDEFADGPSPFYYDSATDEIWADLEVLSGESLDSDLKYFGTGGNFSDALDTTSVVSTVSQLDYVDFWGLASITYFKKQITTAAGSATSASGKSLPSDAATTIKNFFNQPVLKYDSPEKDPWTSSICTAAKNDGIIIYSIGFKAGTEGEAVLSDCASSDAHFFTAESDTLEDVFASIGIQINQLKLTN